jgi:glycosyltransferase involved in cell wall biosynthesis
LILAGPIDEAYHASLKMLPEYACVDYRGVVEPEEVASIMTECFAGTSLLLDVGQYWKDDALPTKVYEYMMAGIPTIASASPAIREAIAVDRFGLCVDPEDIQSVTAAILQLRDDPGIANEMGENGRRTVIEKYNWAIEEKRLLELYAVLSGGMCRVRGEK